MAPQDIRRHLQARPFRPFRLFITDGSTYDVLDPSVAYVDLAQVVIGINFDDATGLPLKSAYVAPNHVTRLEPMDEARPGGNGSPGRGSSGD
jgi:hypothetical protein